MNRSAGRWRGYAVLLGLLCALPRAAQAETSSVKASSAAGTKSSASSAKGSVGSAKPAAASAKAPGTKAASAAAEPLSVVDEKATATFKEGLAAFDRRDFEAARVAFLQTYALKPAVPVVLRNLGLAEIYSGRYLDGARRLARVLHTTDEGSSEDRARMLESLKKAEAHLERVSLEVRQEGAEILIDGVDLGTSPLRFLWYVAPGGYELRVQKAGFQPHTESRVALAGAAQHLLISLAPEPPPPPVAPRAAPVDAPSSAGPNGWLLLTGGLLSAAALAGGVAFTLAARSNADKVDRIGAELDRYTGYSCKSPNVAECGPLLQATKTYDRQQRLALASFATAGVSSLATLLYGLLGGQSAAEGDPPLALGPRSGRSLSAVWLGPGPALLIRSDF